MPLSQAIPLGLQHVLAMFVGNLTPLLIITGACGIPINPALARIQTEGGIVQGIGHTLMENVTYKSVGKPIEASLMQYKIPTQLNMDKLKVEFEHSYEPNGPFGAKSIGEIVMPYKEILVSIRSRKSQKIIVSLYF